MAATTVSALLMIVLLQQRRFVQKRKRKREESKREVDVFKRGQSRLIYGNAIDLGPCCGYDERGALHRKLVGSTPEKRHPGLARRCAVNETLRTT
jgi:hypothetical protein